MITLTQSSNFIDFRTNAIGVPETGLKLANKLCNNGDSCSNKRANHAKVVPLSNVPTNPTRDASMGYQEGCI